MKYTLLILSNIFVWTVGSFAQSSYTVLYDDSKSEIAGASNMHLVHRVAYGVQEKFIPDSLINNRQAGGKLLNMGYRAAKSFLIDFQQDFFIALTQHEVFGHGARFREFGYTHNSVRLSPFFPFGTGSGSLGSGGLKKGETVTPQENITIVLGGIEANRVLANNIADGLVFTNSIHYRDALLYLISQNNQLHYIWVSKLSKIDPGFGSGDIDSYLFELNNLYLTTGEKALSHEILARQSLITLLNPIQLYAAFTLVYKYGITGQRRLANVPMIRLGNIRYLPALNYTLTPFGSQYHFTNYFKYKRALFVGDLTLGDNHFHDFYGINLKGQNFLSTKRLFVNAYFGLWNQPEIELTDKNAKTFRNVTGAMIKADLCIQPLQFQDNMRCFLQVGYKTKGYTIGEQLNEGVIFRFGLSFMPNDN